MLLFDKAWARRRLQRIGCPCGLRVMKTWGKKCYLKFGTGKLSGWLIPLQIKFNFQWEMCQTHLIPEKKLKNASAWLLIMLKYRKSNVEWSTSRMIDASRFSQLHYPHVSSFFQVHGGYVRGVQERNPVELHLVPKLPVRVTTGNHQWLGPVTIFWDTQKLQKISKIYTMILLISTSFPENTWKYTTHKKKTNIESKNWVCRTIVKSVQNHTPRPTVFSSGSMSDFSASTIYFIVQSFRYGSNNHHVWYDQPPKIDWKNMIHIIINYGW